MSSQTAHPPQRKAAVRLNNNHCNGAFMHKGIILCKQTLVVIPSWRQYIVTTSHELGAANFTPIKRCVTQNWNMRQLAYLSALLHAHTFIPSWRYATLAPIFRIPDRFIELHSKSSRSETNLGVSRCRSGMWKLLKGERLDVFRMPSRYLAR